MMRSWRGTLSGYRGATYELGHEGNHEIEETDGLDESEAENGIREELATESGVAGNTVEEGSEDETDTDTGAGQTDGGGTHAEVLGSLDHGLGDLRRVGAAGLEAESLAGGGIEDGRSLLALEGLEGGGWSGNFRSDSARRGRLHAHDYGGFTLSTYRRRCACRRWRPERGGQGGRPWSRPRPSARPGGRREHGWRPLYLEGRCGAGGSEIG